MSIKALVEALRTYADGPTDPDAAIKLDDAHRETQTTGATGEYADRIVSLILEDRDETGLQFETISAMARDLANWL